MAVVSLCTDATFSLKKLSRSYTDIVSFAGCSNFLVPSIDAMAAQGLTRLFGKLQVLESSLCLSLRVVLDPCSTIEHGSTTTRKFNGSDDLASLNVGTGQCILHP